MRNYLNKCTVADYRVATFSATNSVSNPAVVLISQSFGGKLIFRVATPLGGGSLKFYLQLLGFTNIEIEEG